MRPLKKVEGVVIHDFCSSVRSTVNTIVSIATNGVTQSSGKKVPGPLYNEVYLPKAIYPDIDDDKRIIRIADGRANHAGRISAKRFGMLSRGEAFPPPSKRPVRGVRAYNARLWGISIARPGDGKHMTGDDWDILIRHIIKVMPRLGLRPDPKRVVGHSELTGRKADPMPWQSQMPAVRKRMAELLAEPVEAALDAHAAAGPTPQSYPGVHDALEAYEDAWADGVMPADRFAGKVRHWLTIVKSDTESAKALRERLSDWNALLASAARAPAGSGGKAVDRHPPADTPAATVSLDSIEPEPVTARIPAVAAGETAGGALSAPGSPQPAASPPQSPQAAPTAVSDAADASEAASDVPKPTLEDFQSYASRYDAWLAQHPNIEPNSTRWLSMRRAAFRTWELMAQARDTADPWSGEWPAA